jgi:hypothetical protein
VCSTRCVRNSPRVEVVDADLQRQARKRARHRGAQPVVIATAQCRRGPSVARRATSPPARVHGVRCAHYQRTARRQGSSSGRTPPRRAASTAAPRRRRDGRSRRFRWAHARPLPTAASGWFGHAGTASSSVLDRHTVIDWRADRRSAARGCRPACTLNCPQSGVTNEEHG